MCLGLCYREEDCVGEDACFKPSITIKSHDLHACNIKRDVGEIISYHGRD
jgi:hypothetical protein